jgi:sigma-B regulation protein RsbQ
VTADVLTRNNVRVLGTGARALVFAQGFGFDLHTWRHVAPAFADDYRIVLFDYVGAGGSDLAAYDASRYRTLDGYASDLLDVCAALDLESVTVVGHSVSAMIAVLASVREPARFHRLVLVCPSPCYRNDPPHYHGGFEREQLDELLELMDHDRDGFARYLAPVVAQNPERPELAEEIRPTSASPIRGSCGASPSRRSSRTTARRSRASRCRRSSSSRPPIRSRRPRSASTCTSTSPAAPFTCCARPDTRRT